MISIEKSLRAQVTRFRTGYLHFSRCVHFPEDDYFCACSALIFQVPFSLMSVSSLATGVPLKVIVTTPLPTVSSTLLMAQALGFPSENDAANCDSLFWP